MWMEMKRWTWMGKKVMKRWQVHNYTNRKNLWFGECRNGVERMKEEVKYAKVSDS
jgi:hypothetical protein